MSSPLPTWAEALQSTFDEAPELGFQWLKPETVPKATEFLLEGLERAPYGDEFQEEGRARIRRSVPLALGPTRTKRLTQIELPSLLLFDPEQPERLWMSLGTQFPPQLWPSAEPSAEGIARDFAVYLARGWDDRATLPCSTRIQRSTLETLGMESVAAFADLMARIEPWLDGQATWANACDDDPWPDNPAEHSMISLRVVSERAKKSRSDRAASVSMRTLWSRSIVTVEHGPFDAVIVEFRYAPAPLVARLPAGDGHLLVPEDLPADLLASLIRSGSTTRLSLEKARAEAGLTPYVVATAATLEPGETTTVALLEELAAMPDGRLDAAAVASDMGARAFVYAAAAEESDPERRAKMLSWIAMSPPAAASTREADESDLEDEDDLEVEDDEDDWDDEDGNDDEEEVGS